jgi:hypothetical protein
MSDYASAITEPFWPSGLPDVHAYFVAEDWTEVTSDRDCTTFAKVLTDLSEDGIAGYVFCVMLDVGKLLPGADRAFFDQDFSISVIYHGGRHEKFSVRKAVAEKAETDAKYALERAKYATMAQNAERDRRESEKNPPNPDLDAWLKG